MLFDSIRVGAGGADGGLQEKHETLLRHLQLVSPQDAGLSQRK
jgi:hypothetical protein